MNPTQHNKNMKCIILTVVCNYLIRISSLTDPKHSNICVCVKNYFIICTLLMRLKFKKKKKNLQSRCDLE